MRIHSDSLDALEIRKAARIAGVAFTRFNLKGSRSHTGAFDVILTGSSTRRQNSNDNPDYAATWDEWGCFLGTLYAIDPAMVTPYYSSADHFHWITNGRYRATVGDDFERGHNHRWEFSGESATGAYMVHGCARDGCDAVRRFGDWQAVSAS